MGDAPLQKHGVIIVADSKLGVVRDEVNEALRLLRGKYWINLTWLTKHRESLSDLLICAIQYEETPEPIVLERDDA